MIKRLTRWLRQTPGETNERVGVCSLLLVALLAGSVAQADMVLSDVILDLQAGERRRDIEVWNLPSSLGLRLWLWETALLGS